MRKSQDKDNCDEKDLAPIALCVKSAFSQVFHEFCRFLPDFTGFYRILPNLPIFPLFPYFPAFSSFQKVFRDQKNTSLFFNKKSPRTKTEQKGKQTESLVKFNFSRNHQKNRRNHFRP